MEATPTTTIFSAEQISLLKEQRVHNKQNEEDEEPSEDNQSSSSDDQVIMDP
jgi:hypothetical protein